MPAEKMTDFQKSYWERSGLVKRRFPQHPVVQRYVLSKIDQVQNYININNDTSLLDVGAGNGFFSYYFEKICEVYAIDFSKKMLSMNLVKKKFLMDASKLEFKDNSFDIVFCHALLHHVENIDKVISEMRRVSRKYVVIIEPNRNNVLMFLFSALVSEERKALKFSLDYLKKKTAGNALKTIAAFSHGIIVPNKTPVRMLSLLDRINFRMPLGMTNILITEKRRN